MPPSILPRGTGVRRSRSPSPAWAIRLVSPAGGPIGDPSPRRNRIASLAARGFGSEDASGADNWQSLADHYSFLVIAPEFTQKNWPKAAGYQLKPEFIKLFEDGYLARSSTRLCHYPNR